MPVHFAPLRMLRDAHLNSVTNIDDILEPAKAFIRFFGLQPFKIIEVKEVPLKRKLLSKSSFKLGTLNDRSHLVVIAIRRTITHADINAFIAGILASKKNSGYSLSNYRRQIAGLVDKEEGFEWTSKQANKALDIILQAVKQANAGAVLIEDIDPELSDGLLGMDKGAYRSYVSIAVTLPAASVNWSTSSSVASN